MGRFPDNPRVEGSRPWRGKRQAPRPPAPVLGWRRSSSTLTPCPGAIRVNAGAPLATPSGPTENET